VGNYVTLIMEIPGNCMTADIIAMVRMVHHPQTRTYADRRRAEGKTDREIRRCLKRYLARRIYRHLNNASATAPGVDET
jgi:hypothetical protein